MRILNKVVIVKKGRIQSQDRLKNKGLKAAEYVKKKEFIVKKNVRISMICNFLKKKKKNQKSEKEIVIEKEIKKLILLSQYQNLINNKDNYFNNPQNL